MGTQASVRLNGAALRAIRSRTIDPHTGKTFTVSGFATAVGVKQPHISLLEGDDRRASRTLLHKLAEALEVPPAALLWAPPKPGRVEQGEPAEAVA